MDSCEKLTLYCILGVDMYYEVFLAFFGANGLHMLR